MRKAVLFIAMSLDGYIADRDGKVDWLSGQGEDRKDIWICGGADLVYTRRLPSEIASE